MTMHRLRQADGGYVTVSRAQLDEITQEWLRKLDALEAICWRAEGVRRNSEIAALLAIARAKGVR